MKFNLREDKEIMRLYNKLLDRDEVGNQNCCEVHSYNTAVDMIKLHMQGEYVGENVFQIYHHNSICWYIRYSETGVSIERLTVLI